MGENYAGSQYIAYTSKIRAVLKNCRAAEISAA